MGGAFSYEDMIMYDLIGMGCVGIWFLCSSGLGSWAGAWGRREIPLAGRVSAYSRS